LTSIFENTNFPVYSIWRLNKIFLQFKKIIPRPIWKMLTTNPESVALPLPSGDDILPSLSPHSYIAIGDEETGQYRIASPLFDRRTIPLPCIG
jgi:hypothetical protein